jgi:hypothetical protein
MLLVAFLLVVLVSWVTLIVALPVAQLLTKFSLPPWGETLWKLAVVAIALSIVSVGLLVWIGSFGMLIDPFVGFVVLWVFMYKWFDAGFLDVLVICIISRVANFAFVKILAGMLPTLFQT